MMKLLIAIFTILLTFKCYSQKFKFLNLYYEDSVLIENSYKMIEIDSTLGYFKFNRNKVYFTGVVDTTIYNSIDSVLFQNFRTPRELKGRIHIFSLNFLVSKKGETTFWGLGSSSGVKGIDESVCNAFKDYSIISSPFEMNDSPVRFMKTIYFDINSKHWLLERL